MRFPGPTGLAKVSTMLPDNLDQWGQIYATAGLLTGLAQLRSNSCGIFLGQARQGT
jgi:hypothetical protein